MSADDNVLSEGKQTLLRALEQVSDIEAKDEGRVRYLCVAYAVQHRPEGQATYTTVGWSATDDPSFVVASLLREVAAGIECGWSEDGEDEDKE